MKKKHVLLTIDPWTLLHLKQLSITQTFFEDRHVNVQELIKRAIVKAYPLPYAYAQAANSEPAGKSPAGDTDDAKS